VNAIKKYIDFNIKPFILSNYNYKKRASKWCSFFF
jgi:hypothetical protein